MSIPPDPIESEQPHGQQPPDAGEPDGHRQPINQVPSAKREPSEWVIAVVAVVLVLCCGGGIAGIVAEYFGSKTPAARPSPTSIASTAATGGATATPTDTPTNSGGAQKDMGTARLRRPCSCPLVRLSLSRTAPA